jgi:hypothetical protein
MLLTVAARVVHHAEVHDRFDGRLAKDVLDAIAAQIHRMVFDVLRLARELAAIEPDHPHIPMQVTGDAAPEIATDPRDQDGVFTALDGARWIG